MSPFSLLCMVAFCSALVLLVLALRLNPRAPLNRAMAWVAFCYALWTLGDAVVISAQGPDTLRIFNFVAAVGYVYGVAAYLTLCLVFTGARPRVSIPLNLAAYLLATVEVLPAFTGGGIISGFHPSPWGNVGIASENRAWAYLDLSLRMAVFLFSIVAYLRARAASHSRRYRSIALYQVIGLVGMVVLQVFCIRVMWQLWGFPEPSVLVGMVAIGLDIYLIERYRFLSLDHPRIEREVLGAIGDAVILFDPQLAVIRANQNTQAVLGREPRAFLGQELPSLFAESESIRQSWRVAVTGKEVKSKCSLNEGEFVMTLSPLLDEFGDLIGGMAIIRKQDSLDAAVAAYGITARERSIILMLMQGITSKEIAEALFIAPNTVKNHVANIYQKTGAGTRVELFRLVLGEGPSSK